jgi:hypothetical protein
MLVSKGEFVQISNTTKAVAGMVVDIDDIGFTVIDSKNERISIDWETLHKGLARVTSLGLGIERKIAA